VPGRASRHRSQGFRMGSGRGLPGQGFAGGRRCGACQAGLELEGVDMGLTAWLIASSRLNTFACTHAHEDMHSLVCVCMQAHVIDLYLGFSCTSIQLAFGYGAAVSTSGPAINISLIACFCTAPA